jgi:predicted MPP superfamily phosphohydrolase
MSDLHIGSFTPEAAAMRWVRAANKLNADLVAITGDLATNGSAFHAQIADVVGALRARDGVVVSPGNHDYFGDAHDLFDRLRMRRARVLRNDCITMQRSGASLAIAGVDDTWTRQADVRKALAKRPSGAPVVLLAHDPDLFPSAVRAGAQLVLSGHTHGGQVAVPLVARWLNLSRLSHHYHLGLYRDGAAHLYVNPGLGTTGPPIRLGVAPELTVLTLEAAPSE